MTLCKQSGGLAQDDAWGETHTHVCGDLKNHGGDHACRFCTYTWRQ